MDGLIVSKQVFELQLGQGSGAGAARKQDEDGPCNGKAVVI
ncbi:MAG: hypothetical protein V4658_15300 [Bacteroidota bacterium]